MIAPPDVSLDGVELLGIIGAVPLASLTTDPPKPSPAAVELGFPKGQDGCDCYCVWHGGYQVSASVARHKPQPPQSLRKPLRKVIRVAFEPVTHGTARLGSVLDMGRPSTPSSPSGGRRPLSAVATARNHQNRPALTFREYGLNKARASRDATYKRMDLTCELQEATAAAAALAQSMFEDLGEEAPTPPRRPRSAPNPTGRIRAPLSASPKETVTQSQPDTATSFSMSDLVAAAERWSAGRKAQRQVSPQCLPGLSSTQGRPGDPQRALEDNRQLLGTRGSGSYTPAGSILQDESDAEDLEEHLAYAVPMGSQVSLKSRIKGERMLDSGALRNYSKQERAFRMAAGTGSPSRRGSEACAGEVGCVSAKRPSDASRRPLSATSSRNADKVARGKEAMEKLTGILKNQIVTSSQVNRLGHSSGDDEDRLSSDGEEKHVAEVVDSQWSRQLSRDSQGRRRAMCTAQEVTLKISIIGASGLRAMDPSGTSDAYCVCEVPKKPSTRVQTGVKRMTVNPVWNETFTIKGCDRGDQINFTVYDQDLDKNEIVGRATLPYTKFSNKGGYSGNWPIYSKHGQVGTLRIKVEVHDDFEHNTGVHSDIAASIANIFQRAHS